MENGDLKKQLRHYRAVTTGLSIIAGAIVAVIMGWLVEGDSKDRDKGLIEKIEREAIEGRKVLYETQVLRCLSGNAIRVELHGFLRDAEAARTAEGDTEVAEDYAARADRLEEVPFADPETSAINCLEAVTPPNGVERLTPEGLRKLERELEAGDTDE